MKAPGIFCTDVRCLLLVGALVLLCGRGVDAQGVASIQNFTMRPFVTGIRPVIGSNGAVGGVQVDADGVVSRLQQADETNLRTKWLRAAVPVAAEINQETKLRMVSLARLDRAIDELIRQGKHPTEEMFCLAGLQRVDHVFVVPKRNDVVLAGPAGAWKINALGDVVSATRGTPVLRLDDLVDALRTGRTARDTPISCSIEPTAAGQKRYAKLAAKRSRFSQAVVRSMEQALGPQQVLLKGVRDSSHLARVLVAADFTMKRLAMGFESSPIDSMPSYLELLQRDQGSAAVTSPRWWMAVNYQPLLHSPDRLAWQIRGPGIKTLTEDSMLNAQGERTTFAANPLAQKWADTMTENYRDLSREMPIFGQLRNCVDLAVVAALLSREGLLTVADCELSVLMNDTRLTGHRFAVPASVPSEASLVRGRAGWIVSISGGVEIDSWSVVERTEVDKSLAIKHQKATPTDHNRWWWQ